MRFLLRCGREDEPQEKEAPRGLISSIFGLTIRSSSPWVGKEQNFAVVKRTLEEHASFLMRKLELRDLVAFVKATHFDFTVCKAPCIFQKLSSYDLQSSSLCYGPIV